MYAPMEVASLFTLYFIVLSMIQYSVCIKHNAIYRTFTETNESTLLGRQVKSLFCRNPEDGASCMVGRPCMPVMGVSLPIDLHVSRRKPIKKTNHLYLIANFNIFI